MQGKSDFLVRLFLHMHLSPHPVPDTFRKKLKSCKRIKFITQFSFVSHEFSLYLLCYLNKEIRL